MIPLDCQVGGCRWGDPMDERCECSRTRGVAVAVEWSHPLAAESEVRQLDFRARLHEMLWHGPIDRYIDAKVFGRHLPGWGLIQLGVWHVCQRYEARREVAS